MFAKKPRPDLDRKIADLAELLLRGEDTVRFQQQARDAAKDITVKDLKYLKRRFHDAPSQSSLYDPETHGLGGWLSVCQFAIFELVYCLGSDALPFIRKVAWGKYDWTQGNAIELLIRMAADGICREELIREITIKFPTVRFEARLYAIQPLMEASKQDSNLASVFEELMVVEDFRDAVEEMS